jgi:hypothetical protein
MQSHETVKQVYQVHFPDATLPNKSTIFRLLNQRRNYSQIFYEYAETGLVIPTLG